MTTLAPPPSPPVELREQNARISRVPYLPGLDGMRALAVIAVMIYHANSSWLPGGFLGVEMFFVISGYLITLLIIAERERTYRVSLVDFWKRRARRLLPALFLLMLLVVLYTAVFEPSAVGQLRGDVAAGTFYGSNWYQLVVGLGYTAAFDFAPLRHLWSLAVEEQFYLVWPLVMVVLLGRRGTRKIADVSRWLFISAILVAVVSALLYHPGVIGEPDVTPEAYWFVGGRAISKLDFLYIGTFSRSAGILLGAAFAMVWRPFAVARGPLGRRGRSLDAFALLAFGGFVWMCWNLYLVAPDGAADSRLFRGGLFASSVFTIVMIAAISHPTARADRVLGNRVLVWIGVRSYGLYLYHWPVYQAIRELAGNKLTVSEFAVATVITVVITEISYRCLETPIRTGSFGRVIRRARRSPNPRGRRVIVTFVGAGAAMSVFATATLATATLESSEIVDEFDSNEGATIDLGATDAVVPGASRDANGPVRNVVAAPVPAPAAVTPTSTTTTTSTTIVMPNTSIPTTDPEGNPVVVAPTTSPNTRPTATSATESPTTTARDSPPTTETTTPPAPPAPVISSLGVVTDVTGITPLTVPPAGEPPTLRLIGFGDSVMLGSAGRLAERGFFVDAVQSRQFSAALPQLQAIEDNGFLGSAVVVHLGTNGSFPQSSLDEMMTTLAGVPIVVFVTGKADRVWIPGNNALIRALPERYSNVTVLDWEVLAPLCPGDCFYSDDIHLDQDGQIYYADLVSRVLGL